MKSPKLAIICVAALAAALVGCSSDAPTTTSTAKAEVKPIVPVTGETALFEMFKSARLWSGDVGILQLENLDIPEAKPQPGKFGAWKATFTSASKRIKREYTYSVAESSAGVHKGVMAGPEVGYVATVQNRNFNVIDVHSDTPDVLETALKQKDLAAFSAKNPDVPVLFILEWTMVTPRPAWRVYWGGTVSTSQASAYIDAGDGTFIKKSR
jgi:hypothetical protein